ncbi:UNVERIFIED_CONTAM: DSBA-like thioredoxin domain-containing protein [Williamsia faeni]
MTTIEFYFDPACPFAWATSRWLVDTTQRRTIDIGWRQMSLAVLNERADITEKQQHHMDVSLKLGRVLAAAHNEGGDAVIGALYTALGQRIHNNGEPVTPDTVAAALTDSGLDPQLADQMTSTLYDGAVRVAHQQSQDKLGDTGGSPITCIDGQCFFGPVLTAIPGRSDGDQLFDAIATLARTPSFAQLQRPHNGPPDFSNN